MAGFCSAGRAPGKPLSFVDHKIKQGNSLIGTTTPALIAKGIPDAAFSALEGDDELLRREPTVANASNATTRKRPLSLERFSAGFIWILDPRFLGCVDSISARK